jgi:predicted DsbA family dithiol-disulfide isomerase
MTTAPIDLDVWADIACPWCFIGSRTLQQVVPLGSTDVRVQHRSFQLQPELPSRGAPAQEFFADKFGGPDAMQEIFARVATVGAGVGITFDFAGMPVAPNTALIHRALLALHDDSDGQRRAVDAAFSAYFEQARDITDPDVVVDVVAQASGVDPSKVSGWLEGSLTADALETDGLTARGAGIHAVPTFVAAGKWAVQGAQPAEVLAALLDRARAGEADPS